MHYTDGHFLTGGSKTSHQTGYVNQRTNGPVNAHLRSAAIPINMFEYYGINPSAGADKPFFFKIINILSICQFPVGFSLQMTF